MRKVFPELIASFDPLCAMIGTEKEGEIAEAVYRSISDLDFAHQLSITCPSNLAVFPVSGVDWRDLGSNLNIVGFALRQTDITVALSKIKHVCGLDIESVRPKKQHRYQA